MASAELPKGADNGNSSAQQNDAWRPKLPSPPQPWSVGTFASELVRLTRRLRVWHITDFMSPIESVGSAASFWQTTSRTFEQLIQDFDSQVHRADYRIYRDGPESMAVCSIPERETNRTETIWLLAVFCRNAASAPVQPIFDYVRGLMRQLLAIQAWRVLTAEQAQQEGFYGFPQDQWMVSGRPIETAILDELVDASRRLTDGPEIREAIIDRETNTRTTAAAVTPESLPNDKPTENAKPAIAKPITVPEDWVAPPTPHDGWSRNNVSPEVYRAIELLNSKMITASVRVVAAMIGASAGLVNKSEPWKTYAAERGISRSGSSKRDAHRKRGGTIRDADSKSGLSALDGSYEETPLCAADEEVIWKKILDLCNRNEDRLVLENNRDKIGKQLVEMYEDETAEPFKSKLPSLIRSLRDNQHPDYRSPLE